MSSFRLAFATAPALLAGLLGACAADPTSATPATLDAAASQSDAVSADSAADDTGPADSADGTSAADVAASCGPLDDVLRANHVQAKGTHNSYHLPKPKPLVPELAYRHAPLPEQLESQGVRHFELDVHYQPGAPFAVHHIPGLDPLSTCPTLVECLAQIKAWSDAHPCHVPLWVMIEPKDELDPEPIAGHWAQLEAEILSVWPRERILEPADVQGSRPDLRTAVTTDGWPLLRDVRGQIAFALMAEDGYGADYRASLPQDGSRLLFVTGEPDEPHVAVVKRDDPSAVAEVQAVVAKGYLVRSRADANPGEPDKATPARLQAALESAAHLLSTDYPVALPGIGWHVDLPGGVAVRCNPLTAPENCTDAAVESL